VKIEKLGRGEDSKKNFLIDSEKIVKGLEKLFLSSALNVT